MQTFDPKCFVPTKILSIYDYRISIQGVLVPEPSLVGPVYSYQFEDEGFIADNAQAMFPLSISGDRNNDNAPSMTDKTATSTVSDVDFGALLKGEAAVVNVQFKGLSTSVPSSISNLITSQYAQNDAYSSYRVQSFSFSEIFNSPTLECIYPANNKVISKYTQSKSCVVSESYEDYLSLVLPAVIKAIESPWHLGWVYKILDFEKEGDTCQLVDVDPETGFVLGVDTKWASYKEDSVNAKSVGNYYRNGDLVGSLEFNKEENKLNFNEGIFPDTNTNTKTNTIISPLNIPSFYTLAIVNKRGITSLRDLNATHLPLLNNLATTIPKFISEKYNIPAQELNLFFHYPPTFNHLHLHITHVSSTFTHYNKCISLQSVIANIELMNDYYQKVKLVYNAPYHQPIAAKMLEESKQ